MDCALCREGTLDLEEVPLCAACRETRQIGRRVALVPPPEALAERMKMLLPRMVVVVGAATVGGVGAAVGLAVAVLAWPESQTTILFVGAPLIAVAVVGLVIASLVGDGGRLHHAGHGLWRDHLVDKLGLTELIGATSPEVYFGIQVAEGGFLGLVPRMDAAIALAWPRGVAVFGAHGSRRVFRRHDVVDGGLRRLWWVWPPRSVWWIEHAEGPLRFAVADGGSFAESRERLRQLAGS
jgi:hypothetical protein